MTRTLDIVQYPAEVLRRPGHDVQDIDGELVATINAMFETMYAAPGVGLAAPQIGRSERFFVMDPQLENTLAPLAMINPEISGRHGEFVWEEGCLSIPGYFAEVSRAETVFLSGIDLDGNPVELELTGFSAVIAQHEIDHLDGILFVDYLSKTRRRLFERDYGPDRFRWKFR